MDPVLSPELYQILFGGGPAGIPTGAPSVVPPPTPTNLGGGVPAGPPAPFPQVQGFEPTNITPGFGTAPPQEAYRSEPASLGQSLEPTPTGGGVPIPRPRPSEAAAAVEGGAQSGGTQDALLKTLRGVTAPAAPTPQRVGTPHIYNPKSIQGGELANLFASLGIGPQQLLAGSKLPGTLGQALGGR